MLLTYGDTSQLKNQAKWYLVEFSSDRTIQSIMKRVGNKIPSIFGNSPIEIFLPVVKRDLDLFEMSTGNYAFCRSTNFSALLRLKTITGIVGLVTEGESNRPSKAIHVEDDYVQQLINEAEEKFNTRASGIVENSFVRIIDGETRDYCGVVHHVNDGEALVIIDLKTKKLLIQTPIRNLIDISNTPDNQRTFYYCPLIKEMVQDLGEEALTLIQEDLFYVEETSHPLADFGPKPIITPVHSRQRTVTALVRKLINEKVVEPMEIAKRVVVSIKIKEVKAPKNLFIVYGIIKNNLMKYHFSKESPKIRNYREVIHKYGKHFKFSAEDIAVIDPTLGVPIATAEVCLDGRSKQARMKKKLLATSV